jgi:hypothetical protein
VSVFTMRAARSGGFVAVLGVAILIETAGFHLVLSARHPYWAWALTLTSLWALVWIVTDYRALETSAIRIDAETISGMIGRRLTFSATRAAVASVEPPRLMASSGPPPGYLNATKPAAPNVLIVFRAPVQARLFGLPRPIRQLALRVDDPSALRAAFDQP